MRKVRTFTDLRGQVRELKITMATRRKIRDACEVDLLAAIQDTTLLQTVLTRITEDDEFVLSAVGAIVGVDASALEESADAQVYADASTALVEAIVDFFPSSSPVRKPLQTVLDSQTAMRQAEGEIVEATMMRAIREAFGTAFNASPTQTNGSGACPEPSAEILAA
jgi:hypothetical protein